VNYGNIEMLKQKIDYLLRNEKMRVKMGNEGRKIAKKYSWRKIVKKYEKLYLNLIKEKK